MRYFQSNNHRFPALFFLLAMLSLFLWSCEPGQEKANSEASESLAFDYLAVFEIGAPIPDPTSKKLKTSISFRVAFGNITPAPYCKSPKPLVDAIDSLTFDIYVKANADWEIESISNSLIFNIDACNGTPIVSPFKIVEKPTIFSSDSTHATLPVKAISLPGTCPGSVLLDGNLIVLVEESLPEFPGTVTLQKVTAWVNGEAYPCQNKNPQP